MLLKKGNCVGQKYLFNFYLKNYTTYFIKYALVDYMMVKLIIGLNREIWKDEFI